MPQFKKKLCLTLIKAAMTRTTRKTPTTPILLEAGVESSLGLNHIGAAGIETMLPLNPSPPDFLRYFWGSPPCKYCTVRPYLVNGGKIRSVSILRIRLLRIEGPLQGLAVSPKFLILHLIHGQHKRSEKYLFLKHLQLGLSWLQF